MTEVLVVDDEYTIRELISIVLEEEGYEVSTATNGGEAMERLSAAQPDLVLLDIMMPVLDGREVLRRMRADPVLRHVPVLVMSAGANPAIRDAASNGFLRKPFDLSDLISNVSNLVRPDA